MKDYKEWLKEECRNFNQVKWLSENLDLYKATGRCQSVFENLQKYGGNIYTYPQEALNAYQDFYRALYNNPFQYMGGMHAPDENGQIFATSVNGYFIAVEDGLAVPIGFLKKGITGYGAEIQEVINSFLKNGLVQFKQADFNLFSKKLQDGIAKYDTIFSSLSTTSKPVGFGGLVGVVVMEIVMLVLFILMFADGVHRVPPGYMIISVLIFLVLLGWYGYKTAQGFICTNRIADVRKCSRDLNDFADTYSKTCDQYFNVPAVAGAEEAGSIRQYFVWEQYMGFYQMIDSSKYENSKKLNPLAAVNVKQLAIIDVIYLIIFGVMQLL